MRIGNRQIDARRLSSARARQRTSQPV